MGVHAGYYPGDCTAPRVYQSYDNLRPMGPSYRNTDQGTFRDVHQEFRYDRKAEIMHEIHQRKQENIGLALELNVKEDFNGHADILEEVNRLRLMNMRLKLLQTKRSRKEMADTVKTYPTHANLGTFPNHSTARGRQGTEPQREYPESRNPRENEDCKEAISTQDIFDRVDRLEANVRKVIKKYCQPKHHQHKENKALLHHHNASRVAARDRADDKVSAIHKTNKEVEKMTDKPTAARTTTRHGKTTSGSINRGIDYEAEAKRVIAEYHKSKERLRNEIAKESYNRSTVDRQGSVRLRLEKHHLPLRLSERQRSEIGRHTSMTRYSHEAQAKLPDPIFSSNQDQQCELQLRRTKPRELKTEPKQYDFHSHVSSTSTYRSEYTGKRTEEHRQLGNYASRNFQYIDEPIKSSEVHLHEDRLQLPSESEDTKTNSYRNQTESDCMLLIVRPTRSSSGTVVGYDVAEDVPRKRKVKNDELQQRKQRESLSFPETYTLGKPRIGSMDEKYYESHPVKSHNLSAVPAEGFIMKESSDEPNYTQHRKQEIVLKLDAPFKLVLPTSNEKSLAEVKRNDSLAFGMQRTSRDTADQNSHGVSEQDCDSEVLVTYEEPNIQALSTHICDTDIVSRTEENVECLVAFTRIGDNNIEEVIDDEPQSNTQSTKACDISVVSLENDVPVPCVQVCNEDIESLTDDEKIDAHETCTQVLNESIEDVSDSEDDCKALSEPLSETAIASITEDPKYLPPTLLVCDSNVCSETEDDQEHCPPTSIARDTDNGSVAEQNPEERSPAKTVCNVITVSVTVEDPEDSPSVTSASDKNIISSADDEPDLPGQFTRVDNRKFERTKEEDSGSLEFSTTEDDVGIASLTEEEQERHLPNTHVCDSDMEIVSLTDEEAECEALTTEVCDITAISAEDDSAAEGDSHEQREQKDIVKEPKISYQQKYADEDKFALMSSTPQQSAVDTTTARNVKPVCWEINEEDEANEQSRSIEYPKTSQKVPIMFPSVDQKDGDYFGFPVMDNSDSFPAEVVEITPVSRFHFSDSDSSCIDWSNEKKHSSTTDKCATSGNCIVAKAASCVAGEDPNSMENPQNYGVHNLNQQKKSYATKGKREKDHWTPYSDWDSDSDENGDSKGNPVLSQDVQDILQLHENHKRYASVTNLEITKGTLSSIVSPAIESLDDRRPDKVIDKKPSMEKSAEKDEQLKIIKDVTSGSNWDSDESEKSEIATPNEKCSPVPGATSKKYGQKAPMVGTDSVESKKENRESDWDCDSDISDDTRNPIIYPEPRTEKATVSDKELPSTAYNHVDEHKTGVTQISSSEKCLKSASYSDWDSDSGPLFNDKSKETVAHTLSLTDEARKRWASIANSDTANETPTFLAPTATGISEDRQPDRGLNTTTIKEKATEKDNVLTFVKNATSGSDWDSDDSDSPKIEVSNGNDSPVTVDKKIYQKMDPSEVTDSKADNEQAKCSKHNASFGKESKSASDSDWDSDSESVHDDQNIEEKTVPSIPVADHESTISCTDRKHAVHEADAVCNDNKETSNNKTLESIVECPEFDAQKSSSTSDDRSPGHGGIFGTPPVKGLNSTPWSDWDSDDDDSNEKRNEMSLDDDGQKESAAIISGQKNEQIAMTNTISDHGNITGSHSGIQSEHKSLMNKATMNDEMNKEEPLPGSDSDWDSDSDPLEDQESMQDILMPHDGRTEHLGKRTVPVIEEKGIPAVPLATVFGDSESTVHPTDQTHADPHIGEEKHATKDHLLHMARSVESDSDWDSDEGNESEENPKRFHGIEQPPNGGSFTISDKKIVSDVIEGISLAKNTVTPIVENRETDNVKPSSVSNACKSDQTSSDGGKYGAQPAERVNPGTWSDWDSDDDDAEEMKEKETLLNEHRMKESTLNLTFTKDENIILASNTPDHGNQTGAPAKTSELQKSPKEKIVFKDETPKEEPNPGSDSDWDSDSDQLEGKESAQGMLVPHCDEKEQIANQIVSIIEHKALPLTPSAAGVGGNASTDCRISPIHARHQLDEEKQPPDVDLIDMVENVDFDSDWDSEEGSDFGDKLRDLVVDPISVCDAKKTASQSVKYNDSHAPETSSTSNACNSNQNSPRYDGVTGTLHVEYPNSSRGSGFAGDDVDSDGRKWNRTGLNDIITEVKETIFNGQVENFSETNLTRKAYKQDAASIEKAILIEMDDDKFEFSKVANKMSGCLKTSANSYSEGRTSDFTTDTVEVISSMPDEEEQRSFSKRPNPEERKSSSDDNKEVAFTQKLKGYANKCYDAEMENSDEDEISCIHLSDNICGIESKSDSSIEVIPDDIFDCSSSDDLLTSNKLMFQSDRKSKRMPPINDCQGLTFEMSSDEENPHRCQNGANEQSNNVPDFDFPDLCQIHENSVFEFDPNAVSSDMASDSDQLRISDDETSSEDENPHGLYNRKKEQLGNVTQVQKKKVVTFKIPDLCEYDSDSGSHDMPFDSGGIRIIDDVMSTDKCAVDKNSQTRTICDQSPVKDISVLEFDEDNRKLKGAKRNKETGATDTEDSATPCFHLNDDIAGLGKEKYTRSDRDFQDTSYECSSEDEIEMIKMIEKDTGFKRKSTNSDKKLTDFWAKNGSETTVCNIPSKNKKDAISRAFTYETSSDEEAKTWDPHKSRKDQFVSKSDLQGNNSLTLDPSGTGKDTHELNAEQNDVAYHRDELRIIDDVCNAGKDSHEPKAGSNDMAYNSNEINIIDEVCQVEHEPKAGFNDMAYDSDEINIIDEVYKVKHEPKAGSNAMAYDSDELSIIDDVCNAGKDSHVPKSESNAMAYDSDEINIINEVYKEKYEPKVGSNDMAYDSDEISIIAEVYKEKHDPKFGSNDTAYDSDELRIMDDVCNAGKDSHVTKSGSNDMAYDSDEINIIDEVCNAGKDSDEPKAGSNDVAYDSDEISIIDEVCQVEHEPKAGSNAMVYDSDEISIIDEVYKEKHDPKFGSNDTAYDSDELRIIDDVCNAGKDSHVPKSGSNDMAYDSDELSIIDEVCKVKHEPKAGSNATAYDSDEINIINEVYKEKHAPKVGSNDMAYDSDEISIIDEVYKEKHEPKVGSIDMAYDSDELRIMDDVCNAGKDSHVPKSESSAKAYDSDEINIINEVCQEKHAPKVGSNDMAYDSDELRIIDDVCNAGKDSHVPKSGSNIMAYDSDEINIIDEVCNAGKDSHEPKAGSNDMAYDSDEINIIDEVCNAGKDSGEPKAGSNAMAYDSDELRVIDDVCNAGKDSHVPKSGSNVMAYDSDEINIIDEVCNAGKDSHEPKVGSNAMAYDSDELSIIDDVYNAGKDSHVTKSRSNDMAYDSDEINIIDEVCNAGKVIGEPKAGSNVMAYDSDELRIIDDVCNAGKDSHVPKSGSNIMAYDSDEINIIDEVSNAGKDSHEPKARSNDMAYDSDEINIIDEVCNAGKDSGEPKAGSNAMAYDSDELRVIGDVWNAGKDSHVPKSGSNVMAYDSDEINIIDEVCNAGKDSHVPKSGSSAMAYDSGEINIIDEVCNAGKDSGEPKVGSNAMAYDSDELRIIDDVCNAGKDSHVPKSGSNVMAYDSDEINIIDEVCNAGKDSHEPKAGSNDMAYDSDEINIIDEVCNAGKDSHEPKAGSNVMAYDSDEINIIDEVCNAGKDSHVPKSGSSAMAYDSGEINIIDEVCNAGKDSGEPKVGSNAMAYDSDEMRIIDDVCNAGKDSHVPKSGSNVMAYDSDEINIIDEVCNAGKDSHEPKAGSNDMAYDSDEINIIDEVCNAGKDSGEPKAGSNAMAYDSDELRIIDDVCNAGNDSHVPKSGSNVMAYDSDEINIIDEVCNAGKDSHEPKAGSNVMAYDSDEINIIDEVCNAGKDSHVPKSGSSAMAYDSGEISIIDEVYKEKHEPKVGSNDMAYDSDELRIMDDVCNAGKDSHVPRSGSNAMAYDSDELRIIDVVCNAGRDSHVPKYGSNVIAYDSDEIKIIEEVCKEKHEPKAGSNAMAYDSDEKSIMKEGCKVKHELNAGSNDMAYDSDELRMIDDVMSGSIGGAGLARTTIGTVRHYGVGRFDFKEGSKLTEPDHGNDVASSRRLNEGRGYTYETQSDDEANTRDQHNSIKDKPVSKTDVQWTNMESPDPFDPCEMNTKCMSNIDPNDTAHDNEELPIIGDEMSTDICGADKNGTFSDPARVPGVSVLDFKEFAASDEEDFNIPCINLSDDVSRSRNDNSISSNGDFQDYSYESSSDENIPNDLNDVRMTSNKHLYHSNNEDRNLDTMLHGRSTHDLGSAENTNECRGFTYEASSDEEANKCRQHKDGKYQSVSNKNIQKNIAESISFNTGKDNQIRTMGDPTPVKGGYNKNSSKSTKVEHEVKSIEEEDISIPCIKLNDDIRGLRNDNSISSGGDFQDYSYDSSSDENQAIDARRASTRDSLNLNKEFAHAERNLDFDDQFERRLTDRKGFTWKPIDCRGYTYETSSDEEANAQHKEETGQFASNADVQKNNVLNIDSSNLFEMPKDSKASYSDVGASYKKDSSLLDIHLEGDISGLRNSISSNGDFHDYSYETSSDEEPLHGQMSSEMVSSRMSSNREYSNSSQMKVDRDMHLDVDIQERPIKHSNTSGSIKDVLYAPTHSEGGGECTQESYMRTAMVSNFMRILKQECDLNDTHLNESNNSGGGDRSPRNDTMVRNNQPQDGAPQNSSSLSLERKEYVVPADRSTPTRSYNVQSNDRTKPFSNKYLSKKKGKASVGSRVCTQDCRYDNDETGTIQKCKETQLRTKKHYTELYLARRKSSGRLDPSLSSFHGTPDVGTKSETDCPDIQPEAPFRSRQFTTKYMSKQKNRQSPSDYQEDTLIGQDDKKDTLYLAKESTKPTAVFKGKYFTAKYLASRQVKTELPLSDPAK